MIPRVWERTAWMGIEMAGNVGFLQVLPLYVGGFRPCHRHQLPDGAEQWHRHVGREDEEEGNSQHHASYPKGGIDAIYGGCMILILVTMVMLVDSPHVLVGMGVGSVVHTISIR